MTPKKIVIDLDDIGGYQFSGTDQEEFLGIGKKRKAREARAKELVDSGMSASDALKQAESENKGGGFLKKVVAAVKKTNIVGNIVQKVKDKKFKNSNEPGSSQTTVAQTAPSVNGPGVQPAAPKANYTMYYVIGGSAVLALGTIAYFAFRGKKK